MALLWQNVFDRELSPTRPHPSITDVRQFLANAPMDARLRNEMITRYYGHFADDLTAFVYRDGELGGHDQPPPNFFSYAHWASHRVGASLQRWWSPGHRRMSRPLERGNAEVFDSMARNHVDLMRLADGGDGHRSHDAPTGRAAPESRARRDRSGLGALADPTSGLPAQLIDAIGLSPEDDVADLYAEIRSRGSDHFVRAAASQDPEERRDLVLRGSAWWVVSEQSVVHHALAVASRILIRRITSPWAAIRMTNRQLQNRVATGAMPQAEDLLIRIGPRFVNYGMPPAVESAVTKGESVADWYETASGTVDIAAFGEPFNLFDQPATVDFWPSLQQRLPVIFTLMIAAKDADWSRPTSTWELDRAPEWPRFRELAWEMQQRLNDGR